jgi:hypothetical protein
MFISMVFPKPQKGISENPNKTIQIHCGLRASGA